MKPEDLLKKVNEIKFKVYELREAVKDTPHDPFLYALIRDIGTLQDSVTLELYPDPESTEEDEEL